MHSNRSMASADQHALSLASRRFGPCALMCSALVSCEPVDSTPATHGDEPELLQESPATPAPYANGAWDQTWFEAEGLAIDVIYSHHEMFAFDIEQWLGDHAEHLVPHAESISHQAGHASISPRLLIAAMELVTQAVSDGHRVVERPFGQLVDVEGFNAQLEAVAQNIASAHYGDPGRGQRPLPVGEAVLTGLGPDTTLPDLVRVYAELFPGVESRRVVADVPESARLIDLGLQFPWLIGEKWSFGGAHTDTGTGTHPLSSLDFFNGGNWGDDLSDRYVVASAAGTIKKHSSCMMEVVHGDGWSTTYYHMDNLGPDSGDSIAINDVLGNYAADKDQALCNGGHSSGPHVHWTLRKDGKQTHLQDYELSGYMVQPGNDSYDADCERFYLHRDGEKICAWTKTLNEGVDDTWPDDDQVQSLTPGQSINIEDDAQGLSYFTLDASGLRAINFELAGGTGDADILVRFRNKVSENVYDCGPQRAGNLEVCPFEIDEDGTFYVIVKAHSDYETTLTTVVSETPKQDDSGVETGLELERGQWHHSEIEVPPGTSLLEVVMRPGTGESDLYVRFGEASDPTDFDCRPYREGVEERCRFEKPRAGTWVLSLRGEPEAEDVQLAYTHR